MIFVSASSFTQSDECLFKVSTLSKMRRGYTMMIGSISNSMNWPNNAIKLDLFVPTRKMLKAMCGVAMLHRHFNFTVKLVKACQREYSTGKIADPFLSRSLSGLKFSREELCKRTGQIITRTVFKR